MSFKIFPMIRAMCHGVMIDSDLANIEPGPVNHSCWLTLANRILRIYVSTAKHSHELTGLAKTIITFYYPAWFTIKCSPTCTSAAKNFFRVIQLLRNWTRTLQRKLLFSCSSRKPSVMHVADENSTICSKAVTIIIQKIRLLGC